MTFLRSCSFMFLAITLIVLHANAREIPQPKNTINNQNKGVEAVSHENNNPTKTNNVNDNNVINPTKGLAKGDSEVNVDDEKNFISFAGVGAAGGIGGVAGVMPIGFIDKGLIPGALPAFGGLGGGGLGGAGGAGGLGGLGGGGLGGGGLGGAAGGAGGLGGAGGAGGLGGLGGGGLGGGGLGGAGGVGGLGGSSRSAKTTP